MLSGCECAIILPNFLIDALRKCREMPTDSTEISMWCYEYIFIADRGIEESNCTDGQVRLQSGALNRVREGRVEVCVNRVWGTVCLKQFSEEDSQVVCSQMDFERNGERACVRPYVWL